MTQDLPGRITEPKELRALAHPTRWAIMDLLGIESTVTATRCAEHLGESVASCSYHLGMLAKYGYVEPADGGQGREKPWKLTRISQSWSVEGLDVEGALAVEALNDVYIDHTAAQLKDASRRAALEPEQWRHIAGSWGTTAHLTVEELTELSAEFAAITDRYRPRIEDPSLRPEGSRPVRVLLASWLPRV
ncbi:winged helix-turn-helix domain-containing protein [Pseudonocardia sp. TRM90224]|uniref:winged helix-turn-helix domain-containing protein n=1 Tax=Pseudonocardia sp. TRM90224 TaxID=2812678 RepID=UPI001E46E751|nr:helix-turn-helix domain-containing protein [Pseudonocardia sp. TRM90224]